MLLRRFLTHVHEQNWFAVVLDFLIVVFGVFIGIQVDGWNQSRIDVQQERDYLELLVRDLDSDYAAHEKFIDAVEHHVSAAGAIIATAEGGPATTVAIEQAFTYLYLTLDYTPPAPTYNGLRNGANLDIFRDPDLRSRIVDYYEIGQASFDNEYADDYIAAQALLHEHFWHYVRFRVPGNPYVTMPMQNDLDWTTLLVPITEAADDIQFLNDLSELAGRGAEILVVLTDLQQDNRTLRNAMLEYLD